MKNLLLTAFVVLGIANAQAQKEVYILENVAEREAEHAVQLNLDDPQGSLYIEMNEDDQYDRQNIVLNRKEKRKGKTQHMLFIEAFDRALVKVIEYDSIAEANNVEKYTKDLEVVTAGGAFVSGGDWSFDFKVGYTFLFVRVEGESVFMIAQDDMTSSSNEYIDKEGSYLAWYLKDIESIKAFRFAIDPITIKTYQKESNNIDALFKGN